jgi:ketosteroid isomerase-like protein
VSREDRVDPEHEMLLADSVGLAMLIVLETLAPAERLAFVLHDMFGIPFEEIASLVDRSPATARQLASRARRRVQGAATVPDVDLARQREVVNAFLAAAHNGDFDGLLAVLDPDVVLRTDGGAEPPGALREIRGAQVVAKQALTFSQIVESVQPVLVNGTAGTVSWLAGGKPLSVIGFTVRGGKIVEMDVVADPERLRQLGLGELNR